VEIEAEIAAGAVDVPAAVEADGAAAVDAAEAATAGGMVDIAVAAEAGTKSFESLMIKGRLTKARPFLIGATFIRE
jgi:hypothetical protein